MASRSWTMSMMKVQTSQSAHSAAERRALLQQAQETVDAERRQQMAAQRSDASSPEDRIRLWERLHGLPLPPESDHKLLAIIAAQTKLSVAAVHEEQKRRALKLS